jgi:hypothetical protein
MLKIDELLATGLLTSIRKELTGTIGSLFRFYLHPHI